MAEGAHQGGHGHAHGLPAATAAGRYRGRLLAVLAITTVVFLAELVGGLLSGSLALLADAGHVLTDSTGLVLALVAAWMATQRATIRRTFGLQRAEVLAALANVLLMVAVAVWVLVQAVDRLREPVQIHSGVMLLVAVGGMLANGVGLLLLRAGQKQSLNLRGAYLEVLGDLVGSALVMLAALLVLLTGWTAADAIASVLIVIVIVPRAWLLLREVVDVLLEATPRGVDLDQVRRHIVRLPGVVGVHDLHAWLITSGVPVLSAHVVVDADCIARGRSGEVLDQLGSCLGAHFDVDHCTFQLEPEGHVDHEVAQHA